MQIVSDPISETYRLIKKYDVRARKRFGQNFLTDARVLDKIVTAAGVTKDDFVLEIGPGLGTLTRVLCDNAKKVLAVELDYDLVDILENEFTMYENLEILQGDILKTDIKKIADEYNDGKPLKIVANLPYYITTPIIMGLFESHAPIKSITVMVQKEVADRMMAKPGDKNCGAISLAVQYYSEVYLAARVPQNCFTPRPKVDSAVIRLTVRDEAPVSVEDEKLMFEVMRAGFEQRRKTLVNALSGSSKLDISKDVISKAIEEAGLSPQIRAEKLDITDFAKLSDSLSKHYEITLSEDEKY
ncbi:MAG: 16S rRNA (adenine(1518)-N(6)/adenine(1519)-N(6))-dimethyltransferase RsmA [Eubacterium sp.]|nr:16S rRNA (adenine(1518)-N(6)/adenine(1519)-N(6))-dimethyltransferase RsmA [Eubacterium sp.]